MLLENKYIVKNNDEYDIGLKFLRIGEYARNRHSISTIGPLEIDKLGPPNERIC